MRTLRLLLAGALAAVGLVALTSTTAHACFCLAGSDREQARASDAVFTATLTEIVPTTDGWARLPASQLVTYRMEVHEVFEGDLAATVDVVSTSGGGACGLERMTLGRSYLVFAAREDDVLASFSCSGTGPTDAGRVAAVEDVTGPGRLMWSVPPAWLSILAF